MQSPKTLLNFSFLSILLVSESALGCPFCHSDLSRLLREGLLRSFLDGTHVLALFAPFLLMALVIFFIDRPPRSEQQAHNPQGEQNV